MKIFIDKKEAVFSKADLPILISGKEKSGASFFSLCLLANLLKNGEKIVFFSAFPAAKEEFRRQIAGHEESAIIIDSGDEKIFMEFLQRIDDLSERVVLIKNIDLYSQSLFKLVKPLKNIIISGDIDKCRFADDLIKEEFPSRIFFSQSQLYPQVGLENLPKYIGAITYRNQSGLIELEAGTC